MVLFPLPAPLEGIVAAISKILASAIAYIAKIVKMLLALAHLA